MADLIRSGIKIERGAQVGEFTVPSTARSPMTIQLEAKGGGARAKGLATEVKCDAYLAAVGRKPNTDNLNLRSAGIQVDDYGGIMVDTRLCATAKAGNVFAAGDVLGRPFLASVGAAQAKSAVISMFGPGLESTLTNNQIVDEEPLRRIAPRCQTGRNRMFNNEPYVQIENGPQPPACQDAGPLR